MTDRRKFLSKITLGWIALVLIPVIYGIVKFFSTEKPVETGELQKVCPVSEVPADSARIFREGKKGVAVVKDSAGDIRVFSAVCTHLGCIIGYDSAKRIFHCPCHGSEFDLNGINVTGPAPKPLAEYKPVIEGGDIYIHPA